MSLPGTSSPTGSSTAVNATVQNLITQANTDFQQAQTDLKNGNFAAYGTDITSLQNVLKQLQQASQATSPSSKVSTPKPSTTKTTKPNASTTTTTSVPSGVALSSTRG